VSKPAPPEDVEPPFAEPWPEEPDPPALRTGAEALLGAGWGTGSGGGSLEDFDSDEGDSPLELSAVNDWPVVVLCEEPLDTDATTGRGRGFTAIATGTAPAIGEPPLNPVGIGACPEGPTSAEGVAAGEAAPPPARWRPIAKKHANTSTSDTDSTTHRPLSVASRPSMRRPSH
jgi:hypothetical protein